MNLANKNSHKNSQQLTIALSLRQPWAELIVRGEKTIETRKWSTNFRGEFYIHASKTIDIRACKEFAIDPDSLVTGALVGKAHVVDVVEYHSHKHFIQDDKCHRCGFYGFAKPRYGFLLKNVKKITPIETRGSLGFFRIEF